MSLPAQITVNNLIFLFFAVKIKKHCLFTISSLIQWYTSSAAAAAAAAGSATA
jgi:hypothetical protein